MPFFNLVNIVHQFLTHTSGIPDYIEVRCDTDSDALSRWFRLYYAYGLMVININDFTLVSHDGGITGFRTTFYMIPEYNFGVVVMLNADNYNPGTIALRAITTYLDLPG
jgi:CubicO group peptidase (beta-lactamase class C family)